MLFSSREAGHCVGALGNETRAVYVMDRFLVRLLVRVRMSCRLLGAANVRTDDAD